MALETLNGVTEINGVGLVHLPESIAQDKFLELIKENYLIHEVENNTLTMKFQDGPIGESGKNGMQIVDALAVIQHIFTGLNEKFPCHENEMTVLSCGSGIAWQAARTANRKARNVEGKSLQ